ncbi:MAG: sigma-E factor negative regulatory protein [Marinomonas foliarum]|uniref:sigma-E factor negative regulatory protein n=1 Tax=Marinomonas foliarum TaxID=491950 RepID=UPI003F9DBE0D
MKALNDDFSENHSSREKGNSLDVNGYPDVLPSLSAMFDGEATEQDLECLLNADSNDVSRQLESFHLIQQTLHKESSVAVGLEGGLLSRIRAELDVDASFPDTQDNSEQSNLLPFVQPTEIKPASRSAWRMALSSVAIAASVTFVVIFAGNEMLTTGSQTPNLTADVRSSLPDMVVTPLAELDSEALQFDNVKLQHYLRQHAEQATMTVGQGMIPMARVVSYPIKE